MLHQVANLVAPTRGSQQVKGMEGQAMAAGTDGSK